MAGCVFALGVTVGLQTPAAALSLPGSAVIGSVSQSVPVAKPKCGTGQHWVPAGYARHGKYRVAHCAPN
jgi:hypothetical protein